MTALDRVLELLEGLKRSGDSWVAKCPAHSDRRASLRVSRGDDDRVLLHCHAGCGVGEIVAALGLTLSDLFERGRGHVLRVHLQRCNTPESGA